MDEEEKSVQALSDALAREERRYPAPIRQTE